MQKIKSTIMKTYIFTLHFSHIQSNYTTSTFDNSHIDLIIRENKRIYDKEKCHIKLLLTIDILEYIIQEVNNNNNELNIKIVLYITFVEFLRAEEFI